ncbi:hypothetical protein E3U43_011581 [Larimichthys crocea]|uniref:Uncharacterized protein n=1 Tax=Larimichthys crocea TaxID=215358 RepID=A0ACD3QK07_LARCR|nr:hypothetical protein E3U43_011581 [Larimichthys crocea]
MSLIFQRKPSHSPVFPKMPSYTPDKHTIWILPINSPPESKPQPLTTGGPNNFSSPPLMDNCLHRLNWLYEWSERMKEFIGRIYLEKRMQQRQHGCRMNLNH